MKRVDDNSYLEQRGRVWWYNRRVPSKFAHLDCRKRIKESLGTTSIEQARYKRDLLAEADDHYWASLKIAEEAHPSSNRETSEAVRRRADSGALRPTIPEWVSASGSDMDIVHRDGMTAGIPRWTSARLALAG